MTSRSLYLFLLLALVFQAAGQPANDNFQNATALTGAFVEGRATLTNATIEPGEYIIVHGMNQTVWYQWTATESGIVSFNAVGINNKQLSAGVYFGRWPELRLINYAYNTPAASMKFPIPKGQIVYFQLGRSSSSILNDRAEVALWTIALQTIGSIFDGLPVAGPATVESDSFRSPVVLVGEQSTGISYPLQAEHGPVNPSEAGFNNSWYRWTAPHSGPVQLKASTPWLNGLPFASATGDKKTIGVFTGPDLPNLSTIATARGTGEIVTMFEAIGGQTYYISVGKQTTDTVIGWIITTLTQTPIIQAPLEIERTVRLRIATEPGRKYQLQFSADLKSWSNIAEPIQGTGSPEWIYSPIAETKQKLYRVQEIITQ